MESTADRFIDVMAKIKDLEKLTSNEEPMRHEIRQMRQVANQILDDAITHANRIVDTAKSVHETVKEITPRPTE